MADWALPTDLVAPPRLVDRRLVPDDGAPPAKGAYRVRDPVTRRVTDEFAAEFQLPDPPGAPPIAPALDGEVRPFNETEFSTRRTQQLSTVEVVKCNGEYSVLLDGHAHRLAEGDGSTRLWLPRFHEQEVPNPQFGAGGGPPPAEPATRRAVAPLYVGLRLERDEFAPLSARIEVTQRVVDGERVRLKGAPVQTIPLTPYGVDDLTTGVVTLPYPAIHTRGPHVILEDNGSVRKAEAAAFIEERRGVFSAAQRSIFGAYSLAGASGDAGGAGFQDFPRLLMSAVLPVPQRLRARAAEGKRVEIPLEEFTLALERLNDTRASVEGERSLGLTPNELRARGLAREAVVLEWLLYGDETPTSPDSGLGTEKVPNETYLAQQERVAVAAPSWIQAVKNQANERLFLTGNQLLPEGLDAHAAIGTRVELTYTLVIEDVEGTTTIVLNPLRSNGVEAGWLMNDYEGQRRRLERTTNKFLATLRRLDTAGSNQRSDSVLGAAVGGLQARARIWAIVTDRAALTRNRRWNDLATRSSARVKEAKRLEQAQVLGVLTIDDAAVERRLRHDIMGQPEPLDPATGGSFRTAELTEPFDPEGRPNRAITAFDRSALDAYRTETRLSYLRAWGLRDKTVIDFDTEAMRLYHDVHTPLPVGETAYGHAWRLLGWSVRSPYPRTDPAVAEAGSVRTMPQHATFQSRLGSIFGSATVLAVMPVPNETGEALLYAKSATEQARQGWRTQAVDWKSVRVAVEYEMARLETRQRALAPPAFHWIELRMEPTETALGAPLRLGSSALAIGGGCVPADVASAVARAEAQARSTDWEVEWGTGGAPSGDAALLRELELAPSLASYAALGAFCEALVHALVRAGTRARLVDYLRNPVELAQRAMRRTAQVVGFAYGTDNADRRSALLSRRDPFFAALVDAPAVNSALHHLPPWLAKQREQEALMLASGAAVLPNTTDEMRVFWSALAQRYADAFASALKKLGARLTVHPVRLGSLALHTMWVRDNRLAQQLVTQLLPPKLPAWTTLASQLYEAAAAYGRVLWVLHGVRGGGGGDERMRRGELSLLLEVVAAHPIALQLPSDDLESQRLLQAPHVAASPGAYGEDAPPTHAGRFPVEDRMASVRVDQLSEVRADAAVESTDALAAQLERLQLPPGAGQSGRYHAPPSGSAASLPGDVQHAAAVEDLPVYGSAVEKVCARLSYGVGAALAAPAGALRLYSTEAAVEGRSRHPYLIERRDQAVVLHLARLSPLGAGGALDEVTDAPLPSDIPTLSRLSAQLLAEDERNWVSGDLRDRQRALMWNTERLLRALMLTSASEGGLYVQAPPGWTGEDLRALVGAMALAEAIRVRLFDSLPSLWLEGDQAPVRALCQELLASLAERVGVMPLREVALVLALRLR